MNKYRNLESNRKKLLAYLLERFEITPEELQAHRQFYNQDFSIYDNSVYDDIKTRLVHLVNYWKPNNTFNERYSFLLQHYKDYDQIIEFGYGLPYLHLTVDSRPLPECIFVDQFMSAKEVTTAILEYMGETAKFVIGDITSAGTLQEVQRYTRPDTKKLFLAVETIEHLPQAELFWKNLAQSFAGEQFSGSLPIGPAVPSHHLIFRTPEEVTSYVSKYIAIKTQQITNLSQNFESDLSRYQCFSFSGIIRQLEPK